MLSSMIKDTYAKWSELQSFVEKYYPNKAVASHVCNMINDNVLSHLKQILKEMPETDLSGQIFCVMGAQ